MTKDTLIILAGDFMDGLNGPYYCPECAILEGLLAYFPATRKRLDVRRIGFPRPRPEMVELLGEDNQECPASSWRTGPRPTVCRYRPTATIASSTTTRRSSSTWRETMA